MRTLLISLLLVLNCSLCFALDWKRLHEEADQTDLTGALMQGESEPSSKEQLYKLGLVYLNLHKNKEAGAVFDKLLVAEPSLVEAKWGKAEVLRRMHKLDESEQVLNEVVKAIPGFSPAYISLAYIAYIKMDFNSSVKLAQVVIHQGQKNVDLSNFVRAYCMLAGAKGMIAHYGGPISKAVNGALVLPALKKAQKLQPNSVAVLFGLGSFYLLAPKVAGGDIDEAFKYLEKGLRVDPGFADIYVRLAQAYRMKKDEARYSEYIFKALSLDPGNELAIDIRDNKCRFICLGR